MENEARLRLQWDTDGGALETRIFSGLPLSSPVAIRLAGRADAGLAALRDGLIHELKFALGASEAGAERFEETPALRALLVLVLDQSRCGEDAKTVADGWSSLPGRRSILPVLPVTARTSAAWIVPASAREANAVFWANAPTEAIAAVLLRAGVTATPRIFISYRQVDSSALAMQLFDGLSHAGFDVFLDHFRIPPGVNFQARLTQELGDKSMMLLLESEHLPESPWVAYEINVAKTCGLGLLALQLPRGRPQAGVDAAARITLDEADFESGRFSAGTGLRDDRLQAIIGRVRTEHDRALIKRRRMLESAFESALALEGAEPPTRMGDGAFHVQGAGKDYLVWLTARPPELPDFHDAYEAVAPPVTGVVIGLSRLMEPPRAAQTQWLAGLCQLHGLDEGQLAVAARDMARGVL